VRLSSFRAAVITAVIFALVLAPALRASADPALWKVQGPHATVHIFGSIHLLKKTTQWRSAKFDAAFNASKSLCEEVPNVDDTSAVQTLVLQYGLDPQHPLSSKLDGAGKVKLKAAAAKAGIPQARVELMQPWLAALVLGLVPGANSGYDPKSGVDVQLAALAKGEGKPLMGFETLEQQMKYFADMPQTLQIQNLLSTLDAVQAGKVLMFDEIVDAWKSADLPKEETLLDNGLAKGYQQLYDVLIVQRNKMFAQDIEKLINGDDDAFVVIGAGHLVGPDSVLIDLAKDGYTAVRDQ